MTLETDELEIPPARPIRARELYTLDIVAPEPRIVPPRRPLRAYGWHLAVLALIVAVFAALMLFAVPRANADTLPCVMNYAGNYTLKGTGTPCTPPTASSTPVPASPRHPGIPAAKTPVQGHLAQTGVDGETYAIAGLLAVIVVWLGLDLVLFARRRRAARR